MKQYYQCIDCNHEFEVNGRMADGTRCPKCNGPTLPILHKGYYCKEWYTRAAVASGICDRCGCI